MIASLFGKDQTAGILRGFNQISWSDPDLQSGDARPPDQ